MDPLNPTGPPWDVSDFYDEKSRRMEGLGAELAQLGAAGQLEHVYGQFMPVWRQRGLRFNFPGGTVTSNIIPDEIPLERFDVVVCGYRWAWTGLDGQVISAPITVAYGTDAEKTLDRMTLVTAVWGSPLRWAELPRVKVYRAGRKLQFRARIDYSLQPEPPDPEDVRGTVMDVTVDILELRPIPRAR